mgnify:CR=1 FL=1|jgi:hypothetical protein
MGKRKAVIGNSKAAQQLAKAKEAALQESIKRSTNEQGEPTIYGEMLASLSSSPSVSGAPDDRNGIACTQHLYDLHPNYNEASGEKVVQGKNNQYITLGRDRPYGVMSGYGGAGDTHSGMIDLVVGRHGIAGREIDADGLPVYLDNHRVLDAARIYISQKTDIDGTNVGLLNTEDLLPRGSVGNPKTRSGILIKADGVRIVAREGIKIIAGADRYNSAGYQKESIQGIDLMGNNTDEGLQPLVKGQNLIKCLESLNEEIEWNTNSIFLLLKWAVKFTTFMTAHTHIVTAPGNPATPSPEIIGGVASGALINDFIKSMNTLMTGTFNKAVFKKNFLTPPVTPFTTNDTYICSNFNNTN